ncbi:unnamed protein product [Orchesella dallaii]|uniref:Odorant receptor n=1 Tax=Orchesella dallaii TaxID=48710 RepID=A0ABP1QZ54_9HEXA
MGFGEAFINTQLVYQRILDTPWIYNTQEGKLTVNPKLKTPWKMPIYHSTKVAIYLFHFYLILRFRHMSKAYNETKTFSPEEIVICITAFAMTTQACVTMYAMEKEPKGFVYSVTQTLKARGVTHLGWPNSRRLPDIPELIGYVIAMVFCNFPLMAVLYPLLRDQDPLNVELKDILPSVPRRLLAVVVYVPVVFFGVTICSQFLLMVLAVVQNLALETDKNYQLSVGKPIHKTPNWVERLVQDILKFVFKNLENIHKKIISRVHPWISKPSDLEANVNINTTRKPEIQQQQLCGSDMSLNERFQIRRKRHITIHLMMDMCNGDVEAFVPTMAGVGMMLCIIFNYALLTLHNHTELRMFLFAGFLLFVVINFFILFLCHHASLPLINTTETIWFWKGRQARKLEKKQLRCMRPFGFKLGRFFYSKKDTALEMNDIILNCTISLLLS